MKNMLQAGLLLLGLTVAGNTLMAQGGDSTGTVVGGKWIVCADTSLKRPYECTAPYTGFEFLADGTYREYPKTMTDPNKRYLTGKWIMNRNEFTIDQDDEAGTLEMPKTFIIKWTDKNHFYSNNKDGRAGPAMYVYFQRVM